MDEVRVSRAEASEVWALRTKVLRPAYEAGRLCVYPEDEQEGTSHWAAWSGEAVIGCVTLMWRPSPLAPSEVAIQLRGMAVSPERQGEGVGARLLSAVLAEAAWSYAPARVVWCNARVGAMSFYASAGFEEWGGRFSIPEAGDHYVMWRELPVALA